MSQLQLRMVRPWPDQLDQFLHLWSRWPCHQYLTLFSYLCIWLLEQNWSLLNTGVSDLHNYVCLQQQVLWHFVELSLGLVLAQSIWILFSVLGQKPLCWTVDVLLSWASPLVTTPGMLVWDVLVSLELNNLRALQTSSNIVVWNSAI